MRIDDRQAGAEIEITPVMMDAAALALSSWDDRFGTIRDAAREVLEAALRARQEFMEG